MLQVIENNLIVERTAAGRTLSFYQREAPIPHYPTAEDSMPLSHRDVYLKFKALVDEHRATRHKVVCIPDHSFAQYIGAPVDQVREILSDLADSGKVHRTSIDSRTGVGCWTLGAGW